MSYAPTVEVLVADVRKRQPNKAARERLLTLLRWFRAETIALADLLTDLSRHVWGGIDGLPEIDDDVSAELARIVATYDRSVEVTR
jgi:hypothetical protein